jgi:hypothetical protein
MRAHTSMMVASLAIFMSPVAVGVEPELLSPANPRAAFYRENAAKIDALRAVAIDASALAADRLAKLEQLQLQYRYAAVPTAALLVSDPQLEIAELAAKILTRAVVMSDHPHPDHTDSVSLAMQQHGPAREALRKAVLDPRPSVRDIAVSSLASLSDKQTLELIDRGVQQNLYSPVQAVNYHGLANPDIAAEHIVAYLSGPNVGAQAAAVSYLGANPQYQPLIKQRFLDSDTAQDVVRVAAANTLGRFDPQFPNYAETTLQDKSLSPAAFETVAKNYFARIDDRSKAVKVFAIEDLVQKYVNVNPNADLSDLQRQIQGLKKM